MLRDISTSVYALKMLRPWQMSPLRPWLRHCLEERIVSLLQVMHKAKYIEVEPSYKNCHIDIYFKTKTAVVHAAKYIEPSAIFFQAFNSVIRNFTVSINPCFEAPTALSLSVMLNFYRTNVEPIDQVKSNQGRTKGWGIWG